jgi:hypothetical protein
MGFRFAAASATPEFDDIGEDHNAQHPDSGLTNWR